MSVDEIGCKKAQYFAGNHQRLYYHRRTGWIQNSSQKYNLGVSSATIRNEMSDLEEMGYLEQPHTSAGRVPSDKAYRLYVDKLIKVRSLDNQEAEYIKELYHNKIMQLEQVIFTLPGCCLMLPTIPLLLWHLS